MEGTWGKIKVYTKLSFIFLVILAALIFIVSNRQPVTIRFMGWQLVETGAWLLIVLAGLVGIAVFLIVRRISSVLRDFRRIRTEVKPETEILRPLIHCPSNSLGLNAHRRSPSSNF